jgi:hypothetical protein
MLLLLSASTGLWSTKPRTLDVPYCALPMVRNWVRIEQIIVLYFAPLLSLIFYNYACYNEYFFSERPYG